MIEMLNALHGFMIEGEVLACTPYGNGHINRTYLVETTSGKRYILQLINKTVFKNPEQLMANMVAVTGHIRKKTDDPRGALTFVPTWDGKSFYLDEDGEYWRVYDFINDSICLDAAEFPSDFYQSAVGFGMFQKMLTDFPAETLYETIPNFHNTQDRYLKFKAAVQADVMGRVSQVKREIDFYLEREQEGCALVELLRAGSIPLRVTHNDTKLNNVMLDAVTRKAICVIDLDTVMPGLSVYDFGDSIRFGAATAAEDEKDLDKVTMSLDLFRDYTDGFLSACGDSLTEVELEMLPMGAKIMTLECGMRFLTDYLQGDTYFRIHYPEQNLDRSRTQAKLVYDMEQKWDAMNDVVSAVCGTYVRK